MLSPSAPIFGNLATVTSRALAGLQRSVGRALRGNDATGRAKDEGDGGKFVYASRLESQVKSAQAMRGGVQNAVSFVQMQDGFLKDAISKYDRMTTLAMQASDVMMGQTERANLDAEFGTLRDDLAKMSLETFNGQRLFRGKAYELVNKGVAINWTDAKAEVSAINDADPDNWQYLATISSDGEQSEIALQIGSVGINAWLGGRDTDTEGEWRWTEGPEGLEDGGKGKLFWLGKANGSAVNGAYENWGSGEPNNAGNEDYLQISQKVQSDNSRGKWNDLPDTNSSSLTYQPYGYVVETDQGKLNTPFLDGLAELENVDIPRFLDSTLFNLSTVEKAVDAAGKLQTTVEILAAQRANVGASMSQLELAHDRLERHIAAGQKSFSRMTDSELAEDLVRVSRDKIVSEGRMVLMAQARGLNRELLNTIL